MINDSFIYVDEIIRCHFEQLPLRRCGKCSLRKKTKHGMYRCTVYRKKVTEHTRCLYDPEEGLTFRQAAYVLHRHVKYRNTWEAPEHKKVPRELVSEALDVAIRALRRQAKVDPSNQTFI